MRKGYFALGVVCLALAAVLVVKSLPAKPSDFPPAVEKAAQSVTNSAAQREPPAAEGASQAPQEPSSPVCPIDFDALHRINPDMYAWLYIPGTDINFPVLRSSGDREDDFYLTHSVEGEPDENGTLFTERSHNAADFSDSVTVVYGHNMRSGFMFGELQSLYSPSDSFETLPEIIIYTPEKELHYRPFAAMPFSNLHLFYQYRDFSESGRAQFLQDLYSAHTFGAHTDGDVEIAEEDRLLALVTCLMQDDDRRFLVAAKLVQSINY